MFGAMETLGEEVQGGMDPVVVGSCTKCYPTWRWKQNSFDVQFLTGRARGEGVRCLSRTPPPPRIGLKTETLCLESLKQDDMKIGEKRLKEFHKFDRLSFTIFG